MANRGKKKDLVVTEQEVPTDTLDPALKPEQQQLIEAVRREIHLGPLPHPSAFQEYEKTLPGAGDRILKMAEEQSRHRRSQEEKITDSGIEQAELGQNLAFILALVTILGGIYLIANNKVILGLAIILAPIASLVAVFIYGRMSAKKESKVSE